MAKELPYLSNEEIEQAAVQYGFVPGATGANSSNDESGRNELGSSENSDFEES